MTDNDPSDYENMDVEKYFKDDDEASIDVISVNTDGVSGYVPIEELEALVERFEAIAEKSGVEMHQVSYESAADELQEVIDSYE